MWAENAGVGVNQCAADTMGIWKDMCGLTTQQMENEVTEPVWEIAQSLSIVNKQVPRAKQWDLLIDHCTTWISDLEFPRLPWKQYIAGKTNLHGQKHEAALDEFVEVGLG